MKKVIPLLSIFLLASCSMNQQGTKKDDYAFRIINDNKSLLITTKANGEETNQDELEIETLPPLVETSYPIVKDKIDTIDDENTPYDYGAFYAYYASNNADKSNKVLNYFKFTFYVKNTSASTSELNARFFINEREINPNGNSLIDTVRLMIFENTKQDDHSYRVFAKESLYENYDINGNRTRREFIAQRGPSDHEDEDHPLAEALNTNSRNKAYVDYKISDFKQNDQIRYTIVAWLEGEDQESSADAEMPAVSSLQFGATFTMYEQK